MLKALLNFCKILGRVYQSVHVWALLHLTVSTSPEEALHNGGGKFSHSFVKGSHPDKILKASFTLSLLGWSGISLATDMKIW